MFDLIKFMIIGCGCAAVYGLATGADLNELFTNLSNQVLPVAKEVIKGLWGLISSALSQH